MGRTFRSSISICYIFDNNLKNRLTKFKHLAAVDIVSEVQYVMLINHFLRINPLAQISAKFYGISVECPSFMSAKKKVVSNEAL